MDETQMLNWCVRTPLDARSGRPKAFFERRLSDERRRTLADSVCAEVGGVACYGSEKCDAFYAHLLRLKEANAKQVEELAREWEASKQRQRRHSHEKRHYHDSLNSGWRRNYLEHMYSDVGSESDGVDVDEVYLDLVAADLATRRKRRTLSAPSPNARKKKQRTVPKPFAMTVREEEKRREQQLVKELVQKSRAAEEDAAKEEHWVQFRAKPVPSHVHEPVFKKMVEEQPKRFQIGPLKSGLRKSRSSPDVAPAEFHSRPFPAHIFTDEAWERQREEALFRQLQKEIRKRGLMTASKWPARMQSDVHEAIRNKIKRRASIEPQRSAAMPAFPFRPVPDFSSLHQRFESAMVRNKATRLSTVVQPFSFDTAEGCRKPSSKATSFKPTPKTVAFEKPISSRPMRRSLSSASLLLTSEAKSTRTSELRLAAARRRVTAESLAEERRLRAQLQAELRAAEWRRAHAGAWTAVRTQFSGAEEDAARRLIQREMEDRERKEEYAALLDAINERILERPTLFERQTKLSARQNAEKRFNETLKKEGLNSDEINRLAKDKAVTKSTSVEADLAALLKFGDDEDLSSFKWKNASSVSDGDLS